MKVYVENRGNILTDILPFLDVTTNMLEAKAYITWNDLIEPQIQNIKEAKILGIPTIVVEHGMKAVSDYQHDLIAANEGMGKKPFTADYFFVWGDKSKNILLEAKVPERKIRVIGAPIVWENEYHYMNGSDIVKSVYYQGSSVTDPKTKKIWDIEGRRSFIPQKEDGNIVSFFPHHDATHIGVEGNRLVWEQLKDRNDVFIKLSDSYLNEDDSNPFIDLIKMDGDKRREKAVAIGVDKPQNILFIRQLLKRSKLVVTTIPGTINGICWAMDVPVLVPRLNWGWRNNEGEVVYDIHSADYQCDSNNINEAIEEILKNDTKKNDREKLAVEFMGIDKGHPIENFLKELKEIVG